MKIKFLLVFLFLPLFAFGFDQEKPEDQKSFWRWNPIAWIWGEETTSPADQKDNPIPMKKSNSEEEWISISEEEITPLFSEIEQKTDNKEKIGKLETTIKKPNLYKNKILEGTPLQNLTKEELIRLKLTNPAFFFFVENPRYYIGFKGKGPNHKK